MRFMKAALMLLIAIDFVVILLAICVVQPLWILLSLGAGALLKGLHHHWRIRHKINHYFQLKKEAGTFLK